MQLLSKETFNFIYADETISCTKLHLNCPGTDSFFLLKVILCLKARNHQETTIRELETFKISTWDRQETNTMFF